MAINLLGNYINAQNNGTDAAASGRLTREEAVRVLNSANQTNLKELLGLITGDTISGKLISLDGKSLLLELPDNRLIKTIVDDNMGLKPGTQYTFEVTNNKDGMLSLRPMHQNLAASSTIDAALRASGIEPTDTTREMVSELMKNNMSINKEMLSNINRELGTYPEASVKDIVLLHKMDIPVNADSIKSIGLYQSNNQWMIENLKDFADNLGKELLTELKSASDASTSGIPEGVNTNQTETLLNTLKSILSGLQNETAVSAEETANNAAASAGDSTAAASTPMPGETGDAAGATADIFTAAGATDKGTTDSQANINNANNLPEINKFNLFKELDNLSKEQLNDPKTARMINSALNEALKDVMLMDPKKLSDKDFVKDYYNKVYDVADKILNTLTTQGKADSPSAGMASDMKGNMNFMNQINDLYNYVQLPLKMNNTHANGDLYVYAKKRGKSIDNSGELTALLHLAMEKLGNVDIFLTLRTGNNLSTKFTLEKEEMIDFIEQNIDILNERLMKKGYSISRTQVAKSDEKAKDESVIDRITGDENNRIILSTQSFDARA